MAVCLKKRLEGEITVFLSLILVIMISVLFTVIDAARANSSAFMTEVVADMALQSSLAEYNSALLDQYDLFFVDIGYGRNESGYILLEEHIKDYMQKNFETEGLSFTGSVKDLLYMNADYAAVLAASGAADDGGIVMERAAVDYMLDMVGLLDTSSLSSLLNEAENEDVLSDETQKLYEETNEELSEFDGSDNPANAVNKVRNSPSKMLKKVTEGKEISDVGINSVDYISNRGCKQRNGFLVGESPPNTVEDLMFQKYLMDKCGNFTKEKEGSLLKYQMEYVLSGKDSDEENLKDIVKKLVLMKEATNFVYIMTDNEKQEEAEMLAMACIITLLFPELLEIVKTAILLAWSYAESLNDVKILLNGGKVPLIKGSDSWKTTIFDALTLNLPGGDVSGGIGYEEHLHIFLAVLNKEERNMRFMDIVEMDIRQVPGNEGFCMDNCVNTYTVEMQTSSSKGYSHQITRTVGFQK